MGLRTAWNYVLAVGMVVTSCSIAAAEEEPVPAIELSSGGNEITLRVAGVSRREVLARLLGEDAVEWLNVSLAEEPIKGEYHGTIDKIVTALLDRSNFVITYDKLRISRIIVVGPISAAQITPGKAGVRKKFAALRSAAKGERYQKRLRETMLEKIRAAKAAIIKRAAALPQDRPPI
jgi:hypothetical protein